jgi:non-specific serine/threonine protein kinase
MSAQQNAQYVAEYSPRRLTFPAAGKSLFLRNNDYWIIRYHRQVAFLKSTRGLHYLATLLRNPGSEFHVRELLACSTNLPHLAGGVGANTQITSGLYAGVPVLDARAKAEYRRRIQDLREELNEAKRFNDPQRKAELRNELEALVDHLAAAVGVGGRDRKTSSDAERARSAVTKYVKKAIQKIGDAIPSLGYHFAARIKTGYFCSYNPHPDRPVTWKV